LALGLADVKASMDVDQVGEAEFAGGANRTCERFGCEPGQVLQMLWPTSSEERLEERVRKNTCVEDVLKSVNRMLAFGVLVVRGHSTCY
jgi:hypothetical protein